MHLFVDIIRKLCVYLILFLYITHIPVGYQEFIQ